MSYLLLSKKYHLMVYENPDLADDANNQVLCNVGDARGTSGNFSPTFAGRAVKTAGFAKSCAAYWSMMCHGNVWHSEPGDVFLVLNQPIVRPQYTLNKVLHKERVGWIFDFSVEDQHFLELEVLADPQIR